MEGKVVQIKSEKQVLEKYWIRLMVVSDIDRLIEIELKVYSGSLYEEADFFLNRIRLAPEFCWVVENQQGVQGYLISYPWAYLGRVLI